MASISTPRATQGSSRRSCRRASRAPSRVGGEVRRTATRSCSRATPGSSGSRCSLPPRACQPRTHWIRIANASTSPPLADGCLARACGLPTKWIQRSPSNVWAPHSGFSRLARRGSGCTRSTGPGSDCGRSYWFHAVISHQPASLPQNVASAPAPTPSRRSSPPHPPRPTALAARRHASPRSGLRWTRVARNLSDVRWSRATSRRGSRCAMRAPLVALIATGARSYDSIMASKRSRGLAGAPSSQQILRKTASIRHHRAATRGATGVRSWRDVARWARCSGGPTSPR